MDEDDDTTRPIPGAADAGVEGDTTVPLDRTVIIPEDTATTASISTDDDTVEIVREGSVEAAADPDPTHPSSRADERTRPADPVRTEGDVPTKRVSPQGSTAVKPVMVAPMKRRRRALRPAPVPPGYGGRALLGPGAGAVATYRPRAIPSPPAVPQELGTRRVGRITTGLSSVGRRSRRLSMLAMGGFGASLVVAVVGLVLIARSAFLGG